MKQLQIDGKKAKQLYSTASPEWKATFEDTFGKEYFSQKITDRVKTFEDACEVLGVGPSYSFNSTDSKDEIAYKKLKIIIQALNEGWTPDWSNSNQKKWYPWMKWNGSGFGFSDSYCDYWATRTCVGSRLCFKSEELAIYAAKQFEAIYNDFLTLN
jgi:hypothetical protein